MSASKREEGTTHETPRSSSSGTISSTSVLGVLPSGVRPVAQHYLCVRQREGRGGRRRTCSTDAESGSFLVSNKLMHFSAIVRCSDSLSLTSLSSGRLANMSFMSFKLVCLNGAYQYPLVFHDKATHPSFPNLSPCSPA